MFRKHPVYIFRLECQESFGIQENGNNMRVLLLVSMCVVFAVAQEIVIPVGINGNDTVTFIRNRDAFGNYDEGYNENQLTGGASFYREKGYANGTRTGSYGYTTRNGLIRIVTYIADKDGYRAEVLTNEPGVGTQQPSNVTITKETEPDPSALTPGSSVSNNEVAYMVAASDVVRNYVVLPNSRRFSTR
ncbi:cuticle protein 14-like [Parasteatoda tepidariorum]|uniref:cuticle protein 14-like n=1 Tax=Parasteatoda tepidariorum TaxID=114398 RepID=UPI00077FD4C3|nr:cuticle protein 14-like [Parasteatoda tepidariorum]